MEFKLLQIKDFKGITELELDFSSGINTIIGANASGKTSILDALFWVLFGKTSDDRTKCSFIPLDENGVEIPGSAPEVSLTITRSSTDTVLTRAYKDARYVQSIDGAPYPARRFDVWVSDNISDADTFKMLINPTFISESLNASAQRELFLSYFEMPNRDDIFAEMKKDKNVKISNTFRELINKHSVEHVVAASTAKIKELEKLIDVDNGRLSVFQETLKEFNCDMTKAELQLKIQRLEIEVGEYQKLLDENRAKDSAIEKMKNNILFAEDKIIHFNERAKERINSLIREKTEESARLAIEIAKQREEYLEKAKALKVDTKCPTCGQAIPGERIHHSETQRKARLKKIEESGLILKDKVDKLTDEIEALSTKKSLPELDAELTALKRDLASSKKSLKGLPKPKQLPPMPDIVTEISGLKAKLQGYDSFEKAKTTVSDIVKIQRLRALEAEENREIVATCKVFENTRADIIVSKVNNEFTNIKISLVEKLKNGSLRDTFSISLGGVPYSELNSAGKLEAGIELTDYIASKKGLSFPMVIDNFERYTDVILPSSKQIIACKAVKGRKLKIERSENNG